MCSSAKPPGTSVAHEEASLRIHGQGVGIAELTLALAGLTPLHDEVPGSGELHDSVVAAGIMSVHDEDRTVGSHQEVRGFGEGVRSIAGDALLPKGHQELAPGTELVDHVAPTVRHGGVAHGIGDPHVAVGIDVHAVWPCEHAGAEAREQVAIQIEEIDLQTAIAASHIKAGYPMSLADSFGVALAQGQNACLVTGDPEFEKVATLIEIKWLPVQDRMENGN